MRLIDLAEALLAVMLKKHDREPNSRVSGPKGSMVSAEWFEMKFVYDGRRLKVSMPAIVLRNAGHDFQLGYIYGTLAQRVKPRVGKCPGCSKLHEPLYGYSKGEIYTVDDGGHA